MAASIATVLQQIAPQVGARFASRAAGQETALAIQQNQLATPLPFTIVPDTLLGLLPVGITGTCGSNCQGDFSGTDDIAVVNNMPTSWSMRYDAATNTPLSAPQLLPANPSILKAVATAATGWNLAPPYAAKGNGGHGLVLGISQSPASQADNLANIIVAMLDFGIERGPNTCAVNVMKPLAAALVQTQLNISAAGSGPLVTKEVFKEFFGSFFDEASNLASILSTCTSSVTFGPLLSATAKLLEENPLGAAAKSAGALGYKIAYVVHYWDALPVTFAICEDANGTIQNCVASLAFTTRQFYTTLGVTASNYTELTAADAKGNPVGVPGGLVYSADDSGAALSLDPTTGVALAIGPSPLFIPTTVTATDPLSGARGSYQVTVVKNPVLSPSPGAVDVGQFLQLSMTDGAGHSLVVPTTGVDWESSDPTILNCVFKVVGGLQCGGSTATTFTGISSGVATVTVSSSTAGFSASAQVQVGSTTCPQATIDQLTVIADAYPFYSTNAGAACFVRSQYSSYVAALQALPALGPDVQGDHRWPDRSGAIQRQPLSRSAGLPVIFRAPAWTARAAPRAAPARRARRTSPRPAPRPSRPPVPARDGRATATTAAAWPHPGACRPGARPAPRGGAPATSKRRRCTAGGMSGSSATTDLSSGEAIRRAALPAALASATCADSVPARNHSVRGASSWPSNEMACATRPGGGVGAPAPPPGPGRTGTANDAFSRPAAPGLTPGPSRPGCSAASSLRCSASITVAPHRRRAGDAARRRASARRSALPTHTPTV